MNLLHMIKISNQFIITMCGYALGAAAGYCIRWSISDLMQTSSNETLRVILLSPTFTTSITTLLCLLIWAYTTDKAR